MTQADEAFGAGDSRLARARSTVLPEWIDGNRHMNAAYYLAAVKQPAIDVHEQWDYADAFRARTGESNFVAEARVLYVRELLLGARIVVTTRITRLERKKMTLLFELIDEERGHVAALVQYLLLHVKLGPPPRSATMPDDLFDRLSVEHARHVLVPLPPEADRLLRART